MSLDWLANFLMNGAETWLPQFMRGSACVVAFLALAVVARGAVRRLMQRFAVERSVVLLVSQGLFYTFMVVGLITGLGTMGINVSALVAGLGLGGFALGFALRDAISNVLAGVLVLVYRPFRVGHRITVVGLEGTVREINLRYTVLETEGVTQLIPNQILFTNPIKVASPLPETPPSPPSHGTS